MQVAFRGWASHVGAKEMSLELLKVPILKTLCYEKKILPTDIYGRAK